MIEDNESDEQFVLSTDEWREFFKSQGVLSASNQVTKNNLCLAECGVNHGLD